MNVICNNACVVSEFGVLKRSNIVIRIERALKIVSQTHTHTHTQAHAINIVMSMRQPNKGTYCDVTLGGFITLST